jgi:hypothetical protein
LSPRAGERPRADGDVARATARIQPAATLRLLALRGRVITSRPAMVAVAAAARRGGRVYTLWPDQRQPMISADMGYPPAAEWLRRTLVPTLRRLPDAAGWMALRAGAVLVAERRGLAEQLGERVLGSGPRVRIAMFSPSGQPVSKVICFLLREGEQEPRLVVKAMAEPHFSGRLRSESKLLAAVRDRVAHDVRVAGALPPAPLFAGEFGAEFMLAEPYDPLGTATGSGTREEAVQWLRAFQEASYTRPRPWDADDARWALDVTRDTWRLAGRAAEDAVLERLRGLLGELRRRPVPRCAVHGDFWRGNVAARDGRIRIYDWEWSELDGTPLFDLWTYELAELRVRARAGERALEPPLRAALARVEEELLQRGLDERLALVTLAPVLGGLSFRIRRRLDMPDEMEQPSTAVIAAAERLLLSW